MQVRYWLKQAQYPSSSAIAIATPETTPNRDRGLQAIHEPDTFPTVEIGDVARVNAIVIALHNVPLQRLQEP